MRHAVIIGARVPEKLRRLDARLAGGKLHGYAMCLNHWLRFLPIPVVLLNAEWLDDGGRLRAQYRYDAATGYHPDCGCPYRYIIAHEIAHFGYVRMRPGDRKKWELAYEPGKPSGYGTTPEESFCEAFAGGVSGLEGRHYELAAMLAKQEWSGV